MIFHENFCERPLDICDTPQWFALRGDLYKEVSIWKNKPFDQVYFEFSKPDCGWINVTVYVNSKKKSLFPLSEAHNPFKELRSWMEDVVNDFKLAADLYIEVEGRTIIFHYEHIKLANVGCGRKFVSDDYDKDEWESYDANTSAPDTGLFYIYDSGKMTISVVCYCRTKDFLASLYNGLMYYASRSNHVSLIGKEWFYMDHDEDGNALFDNWDFYNTIKSPLIEWNHNAKCAFRHERPVFKETPKIKETVHMWAEWGDGLFWHQRGGCCGNAEGFFVDTDNTRVDLSDIPELREWYDEFDMSIPEIGRTKEEYEDWYKRGWELAKKIRMRLPESVDLFYEWKYFPLEGSKWGHDHISILVPDERLLIKRQTKKE